jgi:hypothetical protein
VSHANGIFSERWKPSIAVNRKDGSDFDFHADEHADVSALKIVGISGGEWWAGFRSRQDAKEQLIPALNKHLQSGNQACASFVTKILGKLGGRNRRLLRDHPVLEGREFGETGLRVSVVLPKNSGAGVALAISLDEAVKTAITYLEKPAADLHCKRQAILLLRACVSVLLPPLRVVGPDFADAAVSVVEDLAAAERGLMVATTSEQTVRRGAARQAVAKRIFGAIIAAGAHPELRKEMTDASGVTLEESICRWEGAGGSSFPVGQFSWDKDKSRI